MTLGVVLFWGVIALALYWLIRTLRDDTRRTPPSSTPDQLLAERFAKGEIDPKRMRRAALYSTRRR